MPLLRSLPEQPVMRDLYKSQPLMSYGIDNVDVLQKAASYVASCMAQSLSNYRCRRPPNLRRVLTSKPPKRWALR
jgi:hypothetical protein